MLHSRRFIACLITASLYPILTGFVLLHNTPATLPATAQNPTITFVWDGKFPTITDKDKFKSGIYQTLDDAAFMQELIKESMAIWNNVPGSFLRVAVLQGRGVMDELDKQHSIVIEKSNNLTTAAFASPQTDASDASIIADCDINIADTSVDALDLAYTLAHELGHCLGLGHAHTNYNAMMGYSRSVRNLTLGNDDKAGLMYLYPDPAVWDGKHQEIVCGTVAGESSRARSFSDAWSLLAFLLLPLLPLLLSLAPRAAPAPSPRPLPSRRRHAR